jgi:hypothetical protein
VTEFLATASSMLSVMFSVVGMGFAREIPVGWTVAVAAVLLTTWLLLAIDWLSRRIKLRAESPSR